MPHAGGLDERTVRAGFEFNFPVRTAHHPDPRSLDGLLEAFKFKEGVRPG